MTNWIWYSGSTSICEKTKTLDYVVELLTGILNELVSIFIPKVGSCLIVKTRVEYNKMCIIGSVMQMM